MIILIISALIYYKRHWMKANSSWNQQKDDKANLMMRWPWSQLVQFLYEAATSINRNQNTLQLNLYGWKTTFSFRSHTDVTSIRNRWRCFSCGLECERKSGFSLFASHYRTIADSICPSTCPLLLYFIQRKIEPKCKRLFLLTFD